MKDILNQVACVNAGPRPPGQATMRPSPEPRRIAREKLACCGATAALRASQKKLLRVGSSGFSSANPP